MVILLACLCLYSSHVLSITITVVSERAINGNMETTLVGCRSNTSFIQRIMVWVLPFLKSVLTSKILLIGIFIFMAWTLYENDDISLQQNPFKTHRKGVQRKSHSSGGQRQVPGDCSFGSKGSGKEKKSKPGGMNAEAELQRSRIIGNYQLGKGWVHIRYKGKWVWMYRPSSKRRNEQGSHSISDIIILSDSYIPHQSNIPLWIHREFYTELDMQILAVTSKYSYFRFKKLPDLGKIKANSYMRCPSYKTCVIDIDLRLKLTQCQPYYRVRDIDYILDAFEDYYKCLLVKASKEGNMSYESFRRVPLSCWSILNMTLYHFFTFKIHGKGNWTVEDFKRSKDALKGEFRQVIDEWLGSRNYSFLPQQNQEINEGVYQGLLKRMQLMNVPFWNCYCISRLLISSRDAPLILFLFWDIFNVLKMEILKIVIMKCDKIPLLKENCYILGKLTSCIEVYKNQTEGGYISKLYLEIVNFIQQDFFGNHLRYKKSQTEKQRFIAFDDYMLSIQAQVGRFLAIEVFIGSSIAIKV